MIYAVIILSALCAFLFWQVIKLNQRIGLQASAIKTMSKMNDTLREQNKIAASSPVGADVLIERMRNGGL